MAACHSALWRLENRGQLVRVCPQQSERLGMSAHITSHRTPAHPSPLWQGLWTFQCPEVPMNSSLLLVWSHPLILSPLQLPHNHSDILAVPVTCELVSGVLCLPLQAYSPLFSTLPCVLERELYTWLQQYSWPASSSTYRGSGLHRRCEGAWLYFCSIW